MQPDDKQSDFKQTVNGGLALFLLLVQCWTRPLQLLTTRPGTAGRRYFGSLPCVLGVLLFPFAAAFAVPLLGMPPDQAGFGGALMFWMVLLLAAMVHRARGEVLRKRGYGVHSLYWGTAVLPGIFSPTLSPGHKYRNDALMSMAWGCGVGVLFHSPLVIAYGMLGGLLMFIPVMFYEAQDNARVEAAEDAQHDAEWLAHQLRERRRNRWN